MLLLAVQYMLVCRDAKGVAYMFIERLGTPVLQLLHDTLRNAVWSTAQCCMTVWTIILSQKPLQFYGLHLQKWTALIRLRQQKQKSKT